VLKVDFVAFFFFEFLECCFPCVFFLNFEFFKILKELLILIYFFQIFHNKNTITSSNSLKKIQNQNNHGLSLIVSKTSKLKKKIQNKKNHGL